MAIEDVTDVAEPTGGPEGPADPARRLFQELGDASRYNPRDG